MSRGVTLFGSARRILANEKFCTVTQVELAYNVISNHFYASGIFPPETYFKPTIYCAINTSHTVVVKIQIASRKLMLRRPKNDIMLLRSKDSPFFPLYVVKVKVKVTLVQALRLCIGRTAHRGSRGLALPFYDHGTRRG